MRIGSKLGSVLVVVGLGCVTRAANAADEFGAPKTFSVSAERLSGVVFASETHDTAGTTVTSKRTTISFMGSALAGAVNVYSLPRIAFDVFPIKGLSLGGSLALINISANSETEAGGISSSTDGTNIFGLLFSPRVGYAVMFNPKVGIWPRGGFTYWWTKATPNDSSVDASQSTSRWAVTLEAPFVISPAPHAAIYVGPTLDLGVAGSNTSKQGSTETSVDYKGTDIGLQAGLGLYF
ncbi:MAG TPA: hypothetical protein VFQ35_16525 [Polyangiaceae bacterium]|nr:hypothetical protein [Polyangiaceae bacterium]